MRNLVFRTAPILGLALVALSASAQTTLTDAFAVSQAAVSRTTTGSSTSSAVSLGGGLTRSLVLSQYTNPNPGIGQSDAFVSGGAFSFDNGPAVASNYSIDYAYATPVSFAGTTGFQVDFRTNDQAYDLFVVLTDSAGRQSSLSGAVRASASPFTVFATGLSGTASLASIVRVSVQSETRTAGVDSSITRVQSVNPVPEPSALAALGLGAAALLRRRRRA